MGLQIATGAIIFTEKFGSRRTLTIIVAAIWIAACCFGIGFTYLLARYSHAAHTRIAQLVGRPENLKRHDPMAAAVPEAVLNFAPWATVCTLVLAIMAWTYIIIANP